MLLLGGRQLLCCARAGTLRRDQRGFNIFRWYKENATTEGQKRVLYDLEHGYWYDANQLVKQRDGRFHPSSGSKPIHPQSASAFPLEKLDRTGAVRSLLSQHASTLLIVSEQRMYADEMIQSWRRPLLDCLPELPVRELVLSTGFYAATSFYFMRLYRRQLSDAGLPTDELLGYSSLFGLEAVKHELQTSNRYVCYPLLLDHLGFIRWRAVGTALPNDIRDLQLVVRKLHNKWSTNKDTSQNDDSDDDDENKLENQS